MDESKSSPDLVTNVNTDSISPKTAEVTDEIAIAQTSEIISSGETLVDLIDQNTEDTSKDSQDPALDYDNNNDNDRRLN